MNPASVTVINRSGATAEYDHPLLPTDCFVPDELDFR